MKDEISAFFGVSGEWVDALSTCYMLVYLLGFLPVTMLLQIHGLEVGLRASATLNAFGALLRFFGTLGVRSFPVAMIGQAICAGSQVINFSCVGSLSRKYFPKSGSQVVGIIWALTYLGVSFGLWLPPMMVAAGGSGMVGCWLLLAIASLLSAISVFVALHYNIGNVPDKLAVSALSEGISSSSSGDSSSVDVGGATSPAFNAPVEEVSGEGSGIGGRGVNSSGGSVANMVREFGFVSGDKKLVLTFCSFGLLMGSNYAVATELQSIFGAVLNDGEVGTLGLLMVIAGVFGVIGAGAVLESYPAFKSDDQNNCDETSDSVVTMPPTPCCPASVVASSTLSATSATMLTLVTIAVALRSSALLFIMMIVYGGAVTALNSTVLERSVALSGNGNASEFTLNSLMMASVQLFGFVMTLITGAIIAPDDGDNYENLGPVYGALLFLAACGWVGTCLIAWSVKAPGRSSARSRRPSAVQMLLEHVAVSFSEERFQP